MAVLNKTLDEYSIFFAIQGVPFFLQIKEEGIFFYILQTYQFLQTEIPIVGAQYWCTPIRAFACVVCCTSNQNDRLEKLHP